MVYHNTNRNNKVPTYMNDICYEYLYYILVVYLDQILVYSKDLVEYTKYVQTPSPSPTP